MSKEKIKISNKHEFTYKETCRLSFMRWMYKRDLIGGQNDAPREIAAITSYEELINSILKETPSQRRRNKRAAIKEAKRQDRLAYVYGYR